MFFTNNNTENFGSLYIYPQTNLSTTPQKGETIPKLLKN